MKLNKIRKEFWGMKKFVVFILILAFPFICGFLNIAHRGDNEQGKFAEHSWVAYDRALCAQADYLELDLQKTSDNVLVVSHDDNLSRVFGIDKNIAEHYYHDLLRYKNQNDESIHSLEEVFKRYQNSKIKFMIEPKEDNGEDIKSLLNLIKQYHLENRVLLESFSKSTLIQIPKIAPEIPLTQLAGNFKILPSIQYYANNFYSENAANYLSDHGKKYLLWGINAKDKMQQCLRGEEKISGILTDYPARLAQALSKNSIFKLNYDINSFSSKSISGRIYLKNGYSLYTDQVKMNDNQLFYHVKPDIWINYYNLRNCNKLAPKLYTGQLRLHKKTLIYTDPSFKKYSGKKLPKDSVWNYFAVKKINGKTAYNLGGSQWVKQ